MSMKNTWKKSKFKKNLKIKKILATRVSFFAQKLLILFFLWMISLHKLHSHVHYEKLYQYKRFQKFSIKTLTEIGCPNFINEQKTGQSILRVKMKLQSLYCSKFSQVLAKHNFFVSFTSLIKME